jgi:hypothetical protein
LFPCKSKGAATTAKDSPFAIDQQSSLTIEAMSEQLQAHDKDIAALRNWSF